MSFELRKERDRISYYNITSIMFKLISNSIHNFEIMYFLIIINHWKVLIFGLVTIERKLANLFLRRSSLFLSFYLSYAFYLSNFKIY